MILNEETTFVIGAGASFPFGYPIGKKLKKYICEEHCNELAHTISNLMCPKLEQEEYAERIRTFQKYFRNCPYTIDKFIRINPEFNVIGKQLIAASLFPKEDIASLNKIETDNWYLTFADLIDLSFDNITKNKMNIITFNYDRSLEEFLFRSLFYLHSMRKIKDDCRDKIDKLSIIHTYGYLAPLKWEDEDFGREYRVKALTRKDLDSAVENIKIIGENTDSPNSNTINRQIKRILKKSINIYFLGFGFDEENIEVLGDDFSTAQRIFCTSFDLGNVKKERANKLIRKKQLNEKCKIEFFDVEVYKFFKEHVHLN